jgi:hypothetical protein
LSVNDSEEAGRGTRALSALGFDPNAILTREPGVILDPHFLAAMHAELDAELGAADARTTLMQIGLIQGLQDAVRFTGEGASGQAVMPPPLAIRFTAVANAEPPGAIELVGSWPERTEAGAHLSLMGPCEHAACHLSAGYTSGWLSGTMEINMLAIESECAATGRESCRFVAREVAVWRASGDARANELIAALPFDAVRELVHSRAALPPRECTDPALPVVHIWGPVMIVPYGNGDEAVRAVDLIETDPAAADVSVVVLDLGDAIIEAAYGALTLEQVIAAAEGYGAETIFAAASEALQPVLEGLSRQPLRVLKDLDAAVASAFQVADAQRMLQ